MRVVPELRQLVDSGIELQDADYGIAEKVDVIFCRNVIIYFDRPTQEQILQSSPGTSCPVDMPLWGTPRRCTGWIFLWCRSRPRSIGEPMFEPESEVAEVYVNPARCSSLASRQSSEPCLDLRWCDLWNERLKIGALCHGMLPKCRATLQMDCLPRPATVCGFCHS